VSGITLDVTIPASPENVWAHLRHIERHVDWMQDAEKIVFADDQREGVGTSFTCLTKIGPLRTRDLMTVTRWEEARAMGVTHRGLFRGSGLFTLEQVAAGTRLNWTEVITFPWYFVGPVGAFVARPILRAVWRGNLRRFSRTISA